MRNPVFYLMLVAGVTLCAASAIHFGLTIPLGFTSLSDPFAGAAIPELILGLTMLVGAASVRRGHRGVGLACTAFTLLVTLYGASVTLRAGGSGDVAYHAALLAVLLATLVLLLVGRTAHTRVEVG
jgi:hypothetical protein